MRITKRDERLVEFSISKIRQVIEIAANAVGVILVDDNTDMLLSEIETDIEGIYEADGKVSVEDIQQVVIYALMNYSFSKPIAQEYVIHKYIRDRRRGIKDVEGILSDSFISKYKRTIPPMTLLGNFVYLRTYARFLSAEGRREFWWEVVKRSVEYNCSLAPVMPGEAEALFENIFNLRQFLSGRTHWLGGTAVSTLYPMGNFNCAFDIIDSFGVYRDLFYILMEGVGAGLRVLKDDVAKLPPVKCNIRILHEEYIPKLKNDREEYTSLNISGTTATITIGDSKEGWATAIDTYFELLSSQMYRKVDMICINYDNIRLKGEPLKIFGGVASGHESILTMFQKIWKVIQNRKSTNSYVKLKTIDCSDIGNIIGENVVAGGVRRTSEIMLIDPDDIDMLGAKDDLYKAGVLNRAISHRQMSNNSVYYKHKPTYEKLDAHIKKMRTTGEPGLLNEEAAKKRRENFNGVNPCGEILLDRKGLCNLTTINVYVFVDSEGNWYHEKALMAVRLGARAAYRMTCVTLELPKWDAVQKRDKVIGCSLTGWQDMVNAVGLDKGQERSLLVTLRKTVHDAVDEYADSLNMKHPIAMTTVKPEGTLSQLPTVSSGVHYSHSPYYIRRVRVNSDDPLIKVCEELNYPIFAEVGQDWDTCNTKVVEFPVKAPEGKTKGDVTALEQLDNYLMFMEEYVDHNCSITIHVRDDEWEAITQAIYDRWDDIVAITLIPYSNLVYKLLPYEEITKEEYEKRVAKMVSVTPSMLRKYEKHEGLYDLEDECESGVCAVR